MLAAGLLLVFGIHEMPTSHATTPIQKTDPQPDTLSLLFIGDVMSHLPQVQAALTDSNTYDYSPCYQFISPYIASADLAIANMECPLAGKPYSGYPQFSCPDEMLLQLRQAGVDVFVTANNHACDRGKQGIRRTLDVLRLSQIPHTGTFYNVADRAARNPLIIEKNGFKIALLNYTYATNGIPVPNPYIVNKLDSNTIHKDLTTARKLHPDYIIVMVHWGVEYQRHQNARQEGFAHYMYDCGADMVIGSHPHVVQPIALQHRDNNGIPQRITAFSLGNFVSNQRDRYTDGGIIFKCRLVKYPSNHISITKYEYLPYWVYRGTYHNKYQYYVVPAKHAVAHNADYDIHGEDSVKLNIFYQDTKSLIDSVPEASFFDLLN